MTKLQRNSKRTKQARGSNVAAKLRTTILNAGCPRLLVFATLIAAALASLIYYQFISAQVTANEALNQTLIQKRKQNAIARMVQETKPQFLDQFRRLVKNYSTARELLPGEAEVSFHFIAAGPQSSEPAIRSSAQVPPGGPRRPSLLRRRY